MADHDECDDCTVPGERVVSTPLISRQEAVTIYVRLQRQGLSPAMCENQEGLFRVCYADRQHPDSRKGWKSLSRP